MAKFVWTVTSVVPISLHWTLYDKLSQSQLGTSANSVITDLVLELQLTWDHTEGIVGIAKLTNHETRSQYSNIDGANSEIADLIISLTYLYIWYCSICCSRQSLFWSLHVVCCCFMPRHIIGLIFSLWSVGGHYRRSAHNCFIEPLLVVLWFKLGSVLPLWWL